jgi:hypothetical protein
LRAVSGIDGSTIWESSDVFSGKSKTGLETTVACLHNYAKKTFRCFEVATIGAKDGQDPVLGWKQNTIGSDGKIISREGRVSRISARDGSVVWDSACEVFGSFFDDETYDQFSRSLGFPFDNRFVARLRVIDRLVCCNGMSSNTFDGVVSHRVYRYSDGKSVQLTSSEGSYIGNRKSRWAELLVCGQSSAKYQIVSQLGTSQRQIDSYQKVDWISSLGKGGDGDSVRPISAYRNSTNDRLLPVYLRRNGHGTGIVMGNELLFSVTSIVDSTSGYAESIRIDAKDPLTNATIWSTSVDDGKMAGYVEPTNLIVSEGHLIQGIKNDQTIWTAHRAGSSISIVRGDESDIVVVADEDSIRGLDGENGNVVWTTSKTTGDLIGIASGPPDIRLIFRSGNEFYCQIAHPHTHPRHDSIENSRK